MFGYLQPLQKVRTLRLIRYCVSRSSKSDALRSGLRTDVYLVSLCFVSPPPFLSGARYLVHVLKLGQTQLVKVVSGCWQGKADMSSAVSDMFTPYSIPLPVLRFPPLLGVVKRMCSKSIPNLDPIDAHRE